jgi:hydroxymethylglutaryl-CoA lyase
MSNSGNPPELSQRVHGVSRVWPGQVSLREVGPRDGLQNEEPVPTQDKIRLVDALSRTGVMRIEAVSFVHPGAVPQMADAEEVWAGVWRRPGVRYSALVPNLRGGTRALAAGFTEVEVVVSASDTHNRRNVNRSTDESLTDLVPLVAEVHGAGGTCEVIIATAFGCPFEGDVSPRRVAWVMQRALEAGADRISFGDTTGMATPRRVVDLLEVVRPAAPAVRMLLHFHDTRGAALANIVTALDYDITDFDASVGGLGGCPFAPGASGNVASEDVVHMLEDMGIATGVDLAALLEAARLAQEIVHRPLRSGVLRAGPRLARSA